MTGSTYSTGAASTSTYSTGAASTGAGTAARGSTCADVAWTRSPAAFDAELDRDVSAERHVAVKALIALAIVGLVICARLVFFG